MIRTLAFSTASASRRSLSGLFSRLARPSLLSRRFSDARTDQELLNTALETEAVPDEAVAKGIWVNNIYRLGSLWYWFRQLVKPLGLHIGEWRQKKNEFALCDQLATAGARPDRIISRLRDGGALLYFANGADAEKAKLSLRRTGFDGRAVQCFDVNGTPFLEDLLLSHPSKRVAAILPAEGITPEKLFPIFRQYGRIHTLEVDKNVARITFGSVTPAIAARNCLHMASLAGMPGAMRLQFEQYSQVSSAFETLRSPKFLPFAAILLTIILALLVEPLRLINVTQKIALHWGDDSSELARPRPQLPITRPEEHVLQQAWSTRPDSVFLLTGPSGTGKTSMLQSLMDGRALCLRIDCAKAGLTSESGAVMETSFVDQLERSLNFWPSFSAITNLTAYFESFFPMKRNTMSSSIKHQLKAILKTLEQALKVVSTTYPRNSQKPFPYAVIVFDSFHELLQSMEDVSNDERRKAQTLFDVLLHFVVQTTQIDQTAHVVFVSDSPFSEDQLNKFNELRGRMRVIPISDLEESQAMTFLETMIPMPALPATVPESTTSNADATTASAEPHLDAAHDASHTASKEHHEDHNATVQYFSVFSILSTMSNLGRRAVGWGQKVDKPKHTALSAAHIDATSEHAAQLQRAFKLLGGRITDLESLVFRVRHKHLSVADALDEMVRESQKEIVGALFGSVLFKESSPQKKRWKQAQAWKTINRLIASPTKSVPQKELLYEVFKGDKDAMKGLVNANLLSIATQYDANNKPVVHTVPSSPLCLLAFEKIVNDAAFAQRMQRHCIESDIAEINDKITVLEDEMFRLEQSRALGQGAELRRQQLDQELRSLAAKSDSLKQNMPPE